MPRTVRSVGLLGIAALLAPHLGAQFNFDIDGKPVQIHSFASQGFLASDQNNYLTMKTSQGSFAFTDFGANISMQINDKFRIGAQLYDRNIGQLGGWHPQMDWATASYKFKDWFGLRGGKVKTALGLYNDTQDNEFLFTFALLPQSLYPLDLRDATIAHTGGDAYGDVSLKRLGTLSYTVFVGDRNDNLYGGYIYLLQDRHINLKSYGGLQYGADLRWTPPVKGLLLGVSRMDEHTTGKGTAICAGSIATLINCANFSPGNPVGVAEPYQEHSHRDWTNVFYGDYSIGNLKFDAEYRRYYRDQIAWNSLLDVWSDNRGWYVSASDRLSKRIEVGAYYSDLTTLYKRGPLAASLDPDLPGNHERDKVFTCRFDLTSFWNVKVEGHFIDGFNNNQYPAGFYTPVNPHGLLPNTKLLVIRTGVNF